MKQIKLSLSPILYTQLTKLAAAQGLDLPEMLRGILADHCKALPVHLWSTIQPQRDVFGKLID